MQSLRARPLEGHPVVSVVIPCYNYGHFLPSAVESALSQHGVDVEVIIVDDASPDGSGDVARRLEREDERVTAVVHESNLRHIATYNDGLSRCTGDYVVLLSADDLLAPGCLARAAAVFESFPNVGLVYGYAPAFAQEPPDEVRGIRTRWSVWDGHEWALKVCSAGANVISNPEAIVRREVMASIGGYDGAYPHAADMHVWLKAASLADVGRVSGPHQAYYRVHGQNMHFESGDLDDLVERASMFDALYGGPARLSRRAGELHRAARRAIAAEALLRAAREHDHGRGDGPVADGYLALALRQGVDVEVMPGWAALHRRKVWTLGAARSLLSLAGKAQRRVRHDLLVSRWRRTGVWCP